MDSSDLKGEGQRFNVFAYPFGGCTEAVGDFVGVQEVIGFGKGGLVLEGQDAGVQGALQGGDIGQQGHDFRGFVAGYLSEQPMELLSWETLFRILCVTPFTIGPNSQGQGKVLPDLARSLPVIRRSRFSLRQALACQFAMRVQRITRNPQLLGRSHWLGDGFLRGRNPSIEGTWNRTFRPTAG